MALIKNTNQEYEYAIDAVNDKMGGGADFGTLAQVLHSRSLDGWRLVTAFTNELGKNAVSVGGIGLNSTVDQVILIFEKKIKRPEQDQMALVTQERRTEIPVLESNLITPFLPKKLTLISKGSDAYVSIVMHTDIGFSLNGLQGDLIVYNIFGDKTVLEDVCFFNFEASNPVVCVSDTFPVSLPEKISRGISSVGLIVKRYLSNGTVVIPEHFELQSIKESVSKQMDGLDHTAIIEKIENMNSAGEITMFVRKMTEERPGLFDENLVQQLFKLYTMEKTTGSNLKADAVKRVSDSLK